MYKDLLPIGSIVQLVGGEKKVMICGRIVTRGGDEKIYDYVSCVYPTGVSGPDDMYFFNRDAIEDIYFIGFQDREEMSYRKNVLNNLGELEIVNGQIVEKE